MNETKYKSEKDYRSSLFSGYQDVEVTVDDLKKIITLKVTSLNDLINIVLHFDIVDGKIRIPVVRKEFHIFERNK